MPVADCGQPLSPRAEDIEYLTRLLCDIDRGRWVSRRHAEPTPVVRGKVVLLLARQVAAVPPEHCAACGGPMDRHVPRRRMPASPMGCGR